jgi:hypothetical protein
MKRKVSVLALAGIALLFVIAILAGQVVTAAEAATVPFKVSCVTYPQPVGGGADPGGVYIELDVPGDCIGTHLGNSEFYSDMTAYVAPPPWPWPQFGDMTFTGADGGQLFASFTGESAPGDGGGLNFWGNYEITWGNGRFHGATGSGQYSGSVNAAGTEGEIVFEGTLLNP